MLNKIEPIATGSKQNSMYRLTPTVLILPWFAVNPGEQMHDGRAQDSIIQGAGHTPNRRQTARMQVRLDTGHVLPVRTGTLPHPSPT